MPFILFIPLLSSASGGIHGEKRLKNPMEGLSQLEARSHRYALDQANGRRGLRGLCIVHGR